jgi:predicted nucleic acid-binding protein
MIIVDTNIVAELMKAPPAQRVVSWMNDQDASTLFVACGVEIINHFEPA